MGATTAPSKGPAPALHVSRRSKTPIAASQRSNGHIPSDSIDDELRHLARDRGSPPAAKWLPRRVHTAPQTSEVEFIMAASFRRVCGPTLLGFRTGCLDRGQCGLVENSPIGVKEQVRMRCAAFQRTIAPDVRMGRRLGSPLAVPFWETAPASGESSGSVRRGGSGRLPGKKGSEVQ